MKSAGNRSSSFLGSMNIFAKGVAVIPRYEVLLKSLSILLMQSLMAVGWESWSFVFTDALSASSSIRRSGSSIWPLALCVLLSASHLMRLFRMRLFFFTTRMTGQLTFSMPRLLLLRTPRSKSFVTDVKDAIFLLVPKRPTPTAWFFIPCCAFGSR